MEHSELDNLIREKLQQKQELHQPELDAAKHFVWSAIQSSLAPKHTLRWYHLAAAVILLLLCFAFVIENMSSRHENELMQLSNKMEALQANYAAQNVSLNDKNHEIDDLKAKLNQIELTLTSLESNNTVAPKTRFVYKTDTVFVKRVEYIRQETTSPEGVQQPPPKQVEMQTPSGTSPTIEYAIYPGKRQWSRNASSENIKVKFGSLPTVQN